MENNTPNFMHWSKPGKAIITGASSGIGATFARKFAQQGFSLVLIDIQQEALLNVADDLRNLYHVDIITLIGDLSKENRIIELSTI